MRTRALLLLLALLAGCRSAPPPPYPGSLVEVTVRVLPVNARVARVSASVEGTPAAALRGGGSAGEWHGAAPHINREPEGEKTSEQTRTQTIHKD